MFGFKSQVAGVQVKVIQEMDEINSPKKSRYRRGTNQQRVEGMTAREWQ